MKFRRVVTFTRKLRFESSVISYGSQTFLKTPQVKHTFESSVILYGSQTFLACIGSHFSFESSVIPYDSLISYCEIKRHLIGDIG